VGRSRRRKLPLEPVEVTISALSHDGRGVAEIDGKKLFVHGALPGETVSAKFTARMRRYDEAEVLEVFNPSAQRTEPLCPHFGTCGGCALQHLDPTAQIMSKQESLLQNLERIGGVKPQEVLKPLTGPLWHYRRKARLSVRYVFKKERLLVGFRERKGRFVADMSECHVLDKRVADLLPHLTRLIDSMDVRDRIAQIEVSCGDRLCALIFRHLVPLSPADETALVEFAREHEIAVLLQSGGPDTIKALEPETFVMEFDIPEYDITLEFGPSDFIQVNAELNQAMVHQALQLLDLQKSDKVLDLFCGLGNFTLPMARFCSHVVGVEGDRELVDKASHNARRNGITNASFHLADLTADQTGVSWLQESYDKVLIDPPRSGAQEILPLIAASGANRLVYVSCHPASLARDAGILVQDYGYVLVSAGVMDMFPHTGHVESIALFERNK
jgi:23S rRNA (uracil1939-C5)-methyltransferase